MLALLQPLIALQQVPPVDPDPGEIPHLIDRLAQAEEHLPYPERLIAFEGDYAVEFHAYPGEPGE